MLHCANLCHSGLFAATFVAVAACGGAVDSGAGDPGGAGTTLGGQSGLGGGAQGGLVAQGGTVSGGGGSPDCTTSTSAVPSRPLCWSDLDCPSNQYCDLQSCGGSSCSCINGAWICTNLCTHVCAAYSTDCIQASAAFADQLNSSSCVVMVRINSAATQIEGYAVNCGLPKPNTSADAYKQLLPMSSINWTGATEFGNSTNTGLYAYTTGGSSNQYSAYFSTTTGNLLLIAQAPVSGAQGTFRVNTTWRAASELGTTCAPGDSIPVSAFATSDSIVDYSLALALLDHTNLYQALRTKLGTVTSVAVTYVNTTAWEHLFFVMAACPNC